MTESTACYACTANLRTHEHIGCSKAFVRTNSNGTVQAETPQGTQSRALAEQATETIVILGTTQYGSTYAQVVIEGTVLYRDADGVFHRACRRCGGSGVKPEFGHVYAGECFGCSWTGVERGYADEAAARKALRRQAQRNARNAAKREAAAVAALAKQRERDHAYALKMNETFDARVQRAASSRYAGPVGSKVTVTGTIAVAMTTDSMYGSKRFVILTGTGSDEGVTLKMSGTSEVLWNVEKGDSITITGTVKEHDARDGKWEAQTVVIRAKEA